MHVTKLLKCQGFLQESSTSCKWWCLGKDEPVIFKALMCCFS